MITPGIQEKVYRRQNRRDSTTDAVSTLRPCRRIFSGESGIILPLLITIAVGLFGCGSGQSREAENLRRSAADPTNLTLSAPNSNEGWIVDDYTKAAALAKSEGKPLFIDFSGYTCTNSRWMEKKIFVRDDVAGLMSRFVRLRLHTDGRQPVHARNMELQKRRFNSIVLPFHAILTPDDAVVATIAGVTHDPATFVSFLTKGVDGIR